MQRPHRPLIDTPRQPPTVWKPKPLPLIASRGIKSVTANFETTGLCWFDSDRPLACAVDYPSDNGFDTDYISWGHRDGNNVTLAQFVEWANIELRGVHIDNINTRFDVHMARTIGIDFETMGCTVGDVAHQAALLDDHRQKTNLDTLIEEFLEPIAIQRLDESLMARYPAGLAAPRAMYNVQCVRRLKEAMWPALTEQDLHRVRLLEEKLIYVVCEMEKNGSPIDVDLLKKWEVKSQKQISEIQNQLAEMTGRKLSYNLWGDETGYLNPDSPREMEELFQKLHLPITRTATGRPSFSSAVLEQIEHPVIDLVRKLNRLIDLRAKYIVGDLKRIGRDGILRYALHQLRAVKDDSTDSGEAGTVTGRFSSTEITSGVGVNIQQRIKVAKQRVAWGYDEEDSSHDDEIYLIRQLHIPGLSGWKWLSADARQIEYRLFANEVDSPRINAQFDKDPLTSFHKFTHAIFKERKPDLTYRRMKDVNFAKIYAAGPKKIAFMLGFITKQQFEELTETKARYSHPLLAETMELLKIYDQEIPEAAGLIQRASRLAKERGYVKSILGRRCRFPEAYRLHKALNSRIQPSAADIMKTKLVELHEARKDTNFLLRFTVHDEVDGDIPDRHYAEKVLEILDEQSFTLKIPILWEVSVGKNWYECSDEEASIPSKFGKSKKEAEFDTAHSVREQTITFSSTDSKKSVIERRKQGEKI